MSDHATTIATAVQLLNAGDVDGYVTTLYHPDARFHGFPPDFGADRDGITAFFRALRAGIPDATIAAQDLSSTATGSRCASPSPAPTRASCSGCPRAARAWRSRGSRSCASATTAWRSGGTAWTTSPS